MNLKLKEILIATGGKLIKGSLQDKVSGISTDTRSISNENLFITLKGKKFDGSIFVEEAIKKGIEGIIIEEGKIKNESLKKLKFCMVVDDTLKALQEIAKYYRNKFEVKVVGITGSNGKTTTKEIIAEILKSKFKVLKSKENYNNEIGVPLTLLSLNFSYEVAVLEMAMRNFSEIALLSEISSPYIGIITNIKEAHLEILRSKKNIAKAKWELVEYLERKKGIAVLNKDDLYLQNLSRKSKIRKIFYGIKKEAEIMAKNIQSLKQNGFKFDIKFKGNIYKDFTLPLLGEHNIYNALAAIAVASLFNIEIELIRERLKRVKPAKGRLQLLKGINNSIIINDTYNASPNSVLSALNVVKELNGERKILVLADMKELGRNEVRFHKMIGGKIGKRNFDLLFVMGKLGKIIGYHSKMDKEKVYFTKEHAEIINILKSTLKKGDVVLIKGSHIMQMEKIVEEIIV